ncbi:transmembrane protein, putative [Entamoeba histolytica KU27]|uniref:Transmembrane protein, putative n=1 Tax=Entamoeba histolytica KU27 TaxID=885311 RepID=M2S3Z6_ENTHI|nr:transmembrane protein, putative [Entamoeba histolytica KU27]
MSFFINLTLSILIPFLAVIKGSLTLDGAIVAGITGLIHLSTGISPALYIMAFFITSSILTKVGMNKKRMLEEKYVEESKRSSIQVLCNSLLATLSCIMLLLTGAQNGASACFGLSSFQIFLYGIIPGFYSCTNGDTWSSEVGILSKTQPFHIITFKQVPAGTNGGVSSLGLISGFGGSLLIGLLGGLVFLMNCPFDITLFVLVSSSITISGVLGNLLDSILGGTLQYSGWDEKRKCVVRKSGDNVIRISGVDVLSNSAINFITSSISGIICGCLFLYLRSIY